MVDVSLGVAVAAQHQHVRERRQQREQARTVRVAEAVLVGFVEQRDVHRQHQQAIARQAGQQAREEGELVLAQAADVGRLAPRRRNDVVQADEGRQPGHARVRVRADLAVVRVQRSLVGGRVGIDVVVAGHVQPGHAQPRGGLAHRREQRGRVVDDVAQRQAQPRAVAPHQRRHDVAPVVVDILRRLRLRIGEHQHLGGVRPADPARDQPQVQAAGLAVAAGARHRHARLHEHGDAGGIGRTAPHHAHEQRQDRQLPHAHLRAGNCASTGRDQLL